MAVLSNLFLHLHPVKARHSGVKMSYTWCMGGLSFFLFLNLTVTGVLLMFYYRPTAEYAYYDIVALREHVPLGIMREIHRWGAHAMVIAVWLHMFRVFMTGSYKPPREFNWVIGVILAGFDPASFVYRLFTALGSIGHVGYHGRHQYGSGHPFYGL
jgi:quinol-cytochrome oxidoreductase complex cytochrome b subunit